MCWLALWPELVCNRFLGLKCSDCEFRRFTGESHNHRLDKAMQFYNHICSHVPDSYFTDHKGFASIMLGMLIEQSIRKSDDQNIYPHAFIRNGHVWKRYRDLNTGCLHEQETRATDPYRAANSIEIDMVNRRRSFGGHPLVYFIHHSEANLIKIGYSASVSSRLDVLEKEVGAPLSLLAVIQPADQNFERSLHKLLSQSKAPLGKEWFYPTPDVLWFCTPQELQDGAGQALGDE